MKMPESASGINPNDEDKKDNVLIGGKVIIVDIDGEKRYLTPFEALNTINDISAKLMAYERSTRKH